MHKLRKLLACSQYLYQEARFYATPFVPALGGLPLVA
jgi:hypothetical protein